MRFYDAKDSADLARVESLLHKGGIEYSLAATKPDWRGSMEIAVAEEDVPKAEELLQQAAAGK